MASTAAATTAATLAIFAGWLHDLRSRNVVIIMWA